ncbi:peptide/nickel transport system substrate-binding protein [Variovorax sp. GrIS 2.14]|uniref:ABC transporter substrate-binding protein n=1 Tax=Variovorax sp. GrIS 2.14 TaxID=3071709 RepID=UPI0038F7DB30
MKHLFASAAAAATLAAASLLASSPSFAQANASNTLRFVPQADLKVLDPVFTTNYVTRNFAYLVYDTLFGQDEQGVPRPQMVDRYTKSKDGLQWTFTLRNALQFHDGAPVKAADCVASLRRWSQKDSYGRAMVVAGAQWEAVDDKTFRLTLKDSFGLVLEALSKVSSHAPFIMSEKAIAAAGNGPVTDVNGSGPYTFRRAEWAPGNKVVFVRNAAYVARSEAGNFLAGSKKAAIERIEWIILPDANTATAALKTGEVDMLELVPPDNVAPLRLDPAVRVGAAGAYQADLIVNNLQPPFNNPKVRQAMLLAVDQERFMAGMGYSLDMRLKHCASFFVCGKPNGTTAGSEAYSKPDLVKAKQLLAESGYKGEKVVVLVPTDYANLNSASLIAIQTMKSLGMNVEGQTSDWATIVSRRVKKDPVDKGGWSAYATFAVESSIDSPLTNFMLGASCGNSMPGWPCDEQLDTLRHAWISETVPGKSRELLERFQRRAFETVPYVPLGQYAGAFAIRKSVNGAEKVTTDVPTLWMLSK